MYLAICKIRIEKEELLFVKPLQSSRSLYAVYIRYIRYIQMHTTQKKQTNKKNIENTIHTDMALTGS